MEEETEEKWIWGSKGTYLGFCVDNYILEARIWHNKENKEADFEKLKQTYAIDPNIEPKNRPHRREIPDTLNEYYNNQKKAFVAVLRRDVFQEGKKEKEKKPVPHDFGNVTRETLYDIISKAENTDWTDLTSLDSFNMSCQDLLKNIYSI